MTFIEKRIFISPPMLRLGALQYHHAAKTVITQGIRAMSTTSPTISFRAQTSPTQEELKKPIIPQPPNLTPTPSPLSTRRLGDNLHTLTERMHEVDISTEATASRSTLDASALPFNPQPKPKPFKKAKAEKAPKKKKKDKVSKMDRDVKVAPSRASGGIPDPTSEYMLYSAPLPTPLQVPQHLLVVIDLNGTILFRPFRKQPTKFIARPHALRFLQYCIDTFTVVIWSSAKPENVNNIISAIIPPDLRQKVVAVWARDKFKLSPRDYDLRVQCYKRLSTVWSDPHIAQTHPEFLAGRRWDQANTVLVDDSYEKGRSEPFNLLEIPEFFGDMNEPGEILPQVHDYLNLLSRHSNVSACLRAVPFRALAAPMRPPPPLAPPPGPYGTY